MQVSCKRSTKKFVAKLSGDVIEEITKSSVSTWGGGGGDCLDIQ